MEVVKHFKIIPRCSAIIGVIPLDLCFIVSNSNIETTNLGIMGNQKCHVPTLKYILYYTPTHKGLHEPENKRA